ncbi:TPA: zincin-like metallopeptidase toxin domain-containing protein [Escherichia coli]
MSEGPGGPQGATAGGTLAMRMLSQQAMVASQMKRAANDKAIAQMLASKKSGPPAARLGDEIQHKSFLGALAGAVLGAIVTIAEGCLIMAACATGPYALVLVPALMYASYKASDYVEEKQNQLESWINSFCDTDGAINTGSENVNINGKPAARAAVTLPPPPPPGAIPEVPQGEPSWGDIATDLLESAAEKAVPLAKAWGNAVITLTDSNAGFMDRVSAGASLLFPAGPVLMEFATMVGGRGEIKKDVDFPEAGEDTALCDKENKPPRIAQGSSNVFINNQPAARQGDKLECSAAIVGGSPDVFIGGEQVTYLDIQPEFPPWQRMILGGITIASYLLPPAGLLGKLKNLARLGKLGNLLGKSGKLLGAKLGALLGKTGKSLKSIANKVIRWVTDPVDPVTGAYCDERTDFTLGQTLPLSFTRFHSSVLPLHGLTGVGWSDSWSEYAWVREQGNRVDIITQGATLRFAFDGDSDTAVIRCIQPPEDERDRHPDESLLKTTYRYNAAGELTEVILPGDETLTFSRDEAGREVFRHSNRGFACEQGWNAASQLVTQRAGFFPEETTWGGLLPSLVREYRYDSAGNVSGVTSREDYGRETRREYRLDRNGQVTAVTASGTGLGYGEGDESYGYDSCGYLKAQSAGRHRISEETDQYAGGHRLKQAGNTQYDYDAAGRMVSRTKHRDGYRPETERFRWDSRDQLTGYCSAQGELWEYRHDASGRRTEKRCDRKKIRFTYLWDGDSIAEIREYRDDKLYSVRHLVFNGFELISQQFSRVRQPHPSVAPQWVTRTNYAVSDLTGRPLMLFNSEGKTVWRPGQTSLWGLALSLPADTDYPDPRGELDPEADPGLLYAGQWQDAESGLCYNRFRYYEPETGMYLVSDPLGLLGGEQTYRYVPNPCGWVDPLGLAASSKISSLMDYIGDGRRVSGHTGFLDGVRLSRSQINNIAKEMEKLGIKVIRKADKYLPPNARAAFDYGLRNIYLRKNATLYEVYHEVIHAKQFAKIGREAYEALGRLSREEHVLNEILKSKNLFNEAEIAHAIKYVEGLREKFMMGLIN